jgi:hypothetical protein
MPLNINKTKIANPMPQLARIPIIGFHKISLTPRRLFPNRLTIPINKLLTRIKKAKAKTPLIELPNVCEGK